MAQPTLFPPHPAPVSETEQLLRGAVDQLVATHHLPAVRFVAAGGNGTVILEVTGRHPLEDLLGWAGSMTREPHWWTLNRSDPRAPIALYASGTVNGLVVSISTPTAALLPVYPTTADVMAAAARARGGQR